MMRAQVRCLMNKEDGDCNGGNVRQRVTNKSQ